MKHLFRRVFLVAFAVLASVNLYFQAKAWNQTDDFLLIISAFTAIVAIVLLVLEGMGVLKNLSS